MKGVVKFFDGIRGYGFITESETSKDYFVHVSDTLDRIKKGDTVDFEIIMGKRGEKAVKVKKEKKDGTQER